ncbi:MAG: hypothetical protein AAF587_15780 [Bacteroidota bacterium]
MKHICLLGLALLIHSLGLVAQEEKIQQQPPPPAPSITAAYYGETIFHSGIKLGYERPFSSLLMEVRNHRYFYVSGNLGYVSHKTVYRAIFADAELGYRFFPLHWLRLGGWIGIGINRYGLSSPSYALQPNGEFEQISSGGARFMSSIGLEIGSQNQATTSFFLKPQLVSLSPHNTGSLKQLVLEIGISKPIN